MKFRFLLFLWTEPACYLRRSESNVINALEMGTRQWVRSHLGASPGLRLSNHLCGD